MVANSKEKRMIFRLLLVLLAASILAMGKAEEETRPFDQFSSNTGRTENALLPFRRYQTDTTVSISVAHSLAMSIATNVLST